MPGGQNQAGTRNILLDPSGEFDSAASIGNVIVAGSPAGAPVYLRDLVRISHGYKSPADFLNYYTWTDKAAALTAAVLSRSRCTCDRASR